MLRLSPPGVRRRRAALTLLCSVISLICAPAAASAAGSAELPRRFLDTTYTPPSGIVLRVHSGDDLQAALNAAKPGDQVVLDAGATFTGNFVLPLKAAGQPVVIRTSDLSSLPPQRTRVSPADASHMARIETPTSDGAINTADRAHDYRFIGIEFGIAPGVTNNYGIVRLGRGTETERTQLPRNIVLDRCWVHGNPTNNARRGVGLNDKSSAVIDSYISDIHEVGADSQAIAGWNGPGPFKIVNNYLEGAAENIIFGGADSPITNLVPADIEIRRNHFFKPLSWRVGDPSYAGIHWSVKNLFELKNAARVLVDGNVFENVWADGQTGVAIILKSENQEGTAPWSGTRDVTFTNNIVRHASAGVTVAGRDPHTQQLTRRVTIANNVFEDIDWRKWGGTRYLFLIVGYSPKPGTTLRQGPAYVFIDHNTAFHSGSLLAADGGPSAHFVYTNNIAPKGQYGVKGGGTAEGTPTLERYFPGYVFARNLIVGGRAAWYPVDNFFPATLDDVGFVDRASGNYRLAPSSPYKGMGTDTTDPGADIDALEAAQG